MAKVKEHIHRLSRKNSVYGSSLRAKCITHLSVSRNKMLMRWKRKRKTGVTLLTAAKKKRLPVSVLLNEAVTEAVPKQKRYTGTEKTNSNKYRSRCGLKASSSNTCNAADCNTPDVVRYQNDTDDNCAETTVSSWFSPVIIDDSSDADCSSAANTTNVYNTSAISDACTSENADYSADEHSRITRGLG